MDSPKTSFSARIHVEPIKLPPVTDILVVAKKHPQGKRGIMESFRFLAPDEFELFEIDDDSTDVEAIVVNRKILRRVPSQRLLDILRTHVFPYVNKGEALKVDLHLELTIDSISGDL